MFEKMKLKKQIKESKERIEFWEQKRTRSQAALLEALLMHKQPSDEDAEYFNDYTAKIETERQKLHQYMAALEA